MGNQEVIPRTVQFMGGKRQSSKALHRTNESKQHEATRKPKPPSKHQGSLLVDCSSAW